MQQTVVGLTGAFGSGCSTAGEHLRDKHQFQLIRLSQPIRDRWKELKPTVQPRRDDLQLLGDAMREEHGTGILVTRALGDGGDAPRLVIDGIRNTGEVAALRDRFGYRFLLMAVLSSEDSRWDRLSGKYHNDGLSEGDFLRDDARDRGEDTKWGQQVELCVAEADIFVDNADVKLKDFKLAVSALADLVTGTAGRGPTSDEIAMNAAYSMSHGSRCLKRHVGAVVVGADGTVIGTGYNENPQPTKPCAEEKTYNQRCYRDILREAHFKALKAAGVVCPVCKHELPDTGPWRCSACAANSVKTNLEQLFVPDKAMNWCTAIHAEIRALRAAGNAARGGTLYTTTFPCTQCAEQIVESGIKRVCFTEVYTDQHSADRLDLGGVAFDRFRGVRSASFERIFPRPK